jgi:hypothetical protein
MRGNQLPVSATRWQHWFQICFAIFLLKDYKIAKNSITAKTRDKISTELESLEF